MEGGEDEAAGTSAASSAEAAGTANVGNASATATGFTEEVSCLARPDGGRWQTLCVSGAPACAGDGCSCGSQQEWPVLCAGRSTGRQQDKQPAGPSANARTKTVKYRNQPSIIALFRTIADNSVLRKTGNSALSPGSSPAEYRPGAPAGGWRIGINLGFCFRAGSDHFDEGCGRGCRSA